MPATTLTVSLELSRRWCSGSRLLSNKPTNAPPNMHPALVKKMACGLIMQLCRSVLFQVSGSCENVPRFATNQCLFPDRILIRQPNVFSVAARFSSVCCSWLE